MSIPYRKIMVPLDGSALAEAALPHATALARQSHAELTLFQVVPPVGDEQFLPEGKRPLSWNDLDELQCRAIDAAMNELQALAINVQFQGITTKPAVQIGEAAESIVDFANAHAIDLIVMSTHGRSGLQRWLMGSIANKVISAAHCPVLLVKATHERGSR